MIVLQGVTKQFPGNLRPTLDACDLRIAAGDFCVLVGANGCGKSTLLQIVGGQMSVDVGCCQVNARAAQVTQDVHASTVAELTVLENLALRLTPAPRLAWYGRHRAQAYALLQELGLGLEALLDKPMGVLSGGQRQVIATIMALHAGEKLLLLDEHTSALDPDVQQRLMRYTAEKVQQMGLTVLMITHSFADALRYGNRLLLLNQGRVAVDVAGTDKARLTQESLQGLFQKNAEHYGDKEVAYAC